MKKINKKLFALAIILLAALIAYYLIEKRFHITGRNAQEHFFTEIEIEPEYKSIAPGEKFIAQLKMSQTGNQEKRDVLVTIVLKDELGNKREIEQQTLAIDTKTQLVIKNLLPIDTPYGTYKLGALVNDVKSGEQLGETYDRILIVDKNEFAIKGRPHIKEYLKALWKIIVS